MNTWKIKNKSFFNYFHIKFILSISLLIIFFFLIIINPPQIITKLLVKNNYKYFVLGVNNNKYKNLIYDFLVQNYFKNNFLKKNKNIKEIMLQTKEFLIDQNEMKFYNSKINLRRSNFSLGSIIIYGFGACESTNGILALRLSKKLENVETFSLVNKSTELSPHTLVKVIYKNKDFYLDIWGNNKSLAFTLENSNLNKELNLNIFNSHMYNNINLSNNTTVTKNFFYDGFTLKKFGLLDYFKSFLFKINSKLISLNNHFKNKDSFNKIIKIKNQNFKERELIMLFIDARFNHINGNLSEAYKNYEMISNSYCDLSICKVAELLIKKKKNI